MARSARSFFAISTAAVALIAGAAHAGGFNVRSQSAVGNGMAHAGAGTSGWGPSSMFWNPAAITATPGRQSDINISYVMPESIISLTGLPVAIGNSGDIAIDKFVPASHNSWQINDRLWIGMSTGAPFGSETQPRNTFAGFPANAGSDVMSLAATPTVGYKVNDWLSIGAGITVQYMDVTLKSVAPGPTPVRLSGDAFGFGFTAGINLTPWQGGSIGVGFRSSITHDLEGRLSPLVPIGVKAKLELPETVTIGIRQELNDQWAVLGSAQWTNWSRLGRVPITTALGPTGQEIAFDYRDEFMFSVGAEYRFNEALTLRAGAAYEISPITNSNRGLRVVDANRIWASVGAGFKVTEKLSGNISYSHLFVEDGRLGPAPYNPTGLAGTTSGSANIISVGLRYRWDSPENTEGVITK